MAFWQVGSDGTDALRKLNADVIRRAAAPLLQQQEREQSRRFEELDGNNDGLVTRDELAKGLLGSGEASSMTLADQLKAEQLADFALRHHDLDGDGALSVHPSLKRQERLGARELRGLDKDCDGRISTQELHARFGYGPVENLLLRHYDLDHDGFIDVGK